MDPFANAGPVSDTLMKTMAHNDALFSSPNFESELRKRLNLSPSEESEELKNMLTCRAAYLYKKEKELNKPDAEAELESELGADLLRRAMESDPDMQDRALESYKQKFKLKSGATYFGSLVGLDVNAQTILTSNTHLSNIAAGAFIFSHTPSPKILLLKRAASEGAFPNKWEVPGGGVEARDDTILDGTVREVVEETGLTVTHVARFLGMVEFPGRQERSWRKYNFLVVVKEGDVKIDESEHADFGYFGKDELEGVEWTSPQMKSAAESAFDHAAMTVVSSPKSNNKASEKKVPAASAADGEYAFKRRTKGAFK